MAHFSYAFNFSLIAVKVDKMELELLSKLD